MKGFEPPTLWSQTRCASQLRYISVTLSELRCKISDKNPYYQIFKARILLKMQGIFTNSLHPQCYLFPVVENR